MAQFDVRAARDILLQGVKEYQPNGDIVDNVWCRRESEKRLQSKITSLHVRRSGGKRESGVAAD